MSQKHVSQFGENYKARAEYGTYNKEFASTDQLFRKACDLAGVQPTKRQASKWRRGLGAAYSKKNEASQV